MRPFQRPHRDRILRFASFEVDRAARELFHEGRRLPLQDKPFELLLALLERPWEVITREELCERLWPGMIVEFDNNLNTAVNKVRAALATAPGGDALVETIPRRGYRLRCKPEAPAAGDRRRWIAAVTAVALTGLAISAWLQRSPGEADPRSASPMPRRALLAVLPFQSLEPGPDVERRAAALTEIVTTELARRLPPTVGVLARGSVLRSGDPPDVASVVDGLGADFVVEGSVAGITDGSLDVGVRLIQAADQAHLWAERFSGDLSILPAIDSAIAEQVGGILGVRLAPTAGATDIEPLGGEAWREYLEARHLLAGDGRHDDEAAERAVEHLRRAVELTPGFARAWAGLSDALARRRVPAAERIPAAREAAERALALDPGLAEGHHRLASIALYHDRDWEEAGRHFRAALTLGPNLARNHHSYAGYLATLGRHDEALASVDRALALDPLSVVLHADAGWYLYVARRHAEAVERCRDALRLDADHRGALGYLLDASTTLGRWPEAREIALRRLAVEGAAPEVVAEVKAAAPEEAVAIYRRWRWRERRADARSEWVSPDELALAALTAGDRDAAIHWLEIASDDRSGWLPAFAAVFPGLDPLRGDPRFESWLDGVGIPR